MSAALLPHQQRVVAEQAALSDNIQKLTAFLAGDKVQGVPAAEYGRLRRQLTAMEQYDSILLERIAAFGGPA